MTTSATLRQINQARVLSALRRGSWSRTGLAEELGLNRSTTTVIINSLLEQGLVREEATGPRDRTSTGRPRVGVTLEGSGAYFAGLEIGNLALTAVVVDLAGAEIARSSEPTRAERGPTHAEQRLGNLLAQLLETLPEVRLHATGLTVPGIVSASGRLDWAPWLGWRNAAMGHHVSARFGVPVYVENDANAAVLADQQSRPRGEASNVVFLLLDSGVGAGVLINGELYRGSAGRVGESGHIRLRPQDPTGTTVEQVLGLTTIVHRFRALSGSETGWPDLLDAIEHDDPDALQLRHEWQTTLGWLAATLAWTLDPDVLVFGGPASALLHADTTALDQSLRANGPAGLSWRLSTLRPTDAALGAVSLGLRAFFTIPSLLQPAPPRSNLEVAS